MWQSIEPWDPYLTRKTFELRQEFGRLRNSRRQRFRPAQICLSAKVMRAEFVDKNTHKFGLIVGVCRTQPM